MSRCWPWTAQETNFSHDLVSMRLEGRFGFAIKRVPSSTSRWLLLSPSHDVNLILRCPSKAASGKPQRTASLL